MSSYSLPNGHRPPPSFSDSSRDFGNSPWSTDPMKNNVTSRGGTSTMNPNGYGPSGYTSSTSTKGLSAASLGDRVNRIMGGDGFGNGDLPRYKDKPYAASRRRQGWRYGRKRWGGLAVLTVFALWYLGAFSLGSSRPRTHPVRDAVEALAWLKTPEAKGKVNWDERRERVKTAFTLSWDAYSRHAWGYDEFKPIAKKGKNMTPQGMGWIIVDALDTLMVMNLTTRLHDARQWLAKLSYEQDKEVNTFETTIRMLGGLLSAHYLSTAFPDMCPLSEDDPGTAGEDLYLEKAKDLGDRIMGAFDSPSGVPFASFNLKTLEGVQSHDDNGASSTAEATTLQLEFKYLAHLTGEVYFWEKAEKVMEVVDNNGAADGLVPIYIYATTGEFRGDNIRLGSRGDSYYEYLIKQYLQTNGKEKVYEELWDETLAGVRKHLITYSRPSGFTVLGERPSGLTSTLSPKMDHLVCFMPGTIALGATGGLTEKEARKLPSWSKKKDDEMVLARELMHTCWGMYKAMKTGLAAEITHFAVDNPPLPFGAKHNPPKTFDDATDASWRADFVVKENDKHNLQRPETVESLFYMWRITGEEVYREQAWQMFESFVAYTSVDDGGGFTSLGNADVIPPTLRDNMESFWLAETLKYMYLIFSPSALLPLTDIVINTEAHPFPRFDMGPNFKTGWARLPRDADGKLTRKPDKKDLSSASHNHTEKKIVTIIKTMTQGLP